MSAAHSNTHQSSFSSSRGKFPRSGNARSSADESSEFKALRSKYSSSLKTLREMFPDWSDADLIYALQEADGNLEITIAHIAEGFAPQWGEVKSRKDKRQAYKQQHEESSRPYEKSYVPRPASFRGGVRGGAARGSRGSYSNAAGSTRPKPAQPDSKPQSSGESNSAAGWNVEPSSSEHKDSSSGWDVSGTPAKLSTPAAKPAAAPAPAPAPVSSKPAPMSWASIAKKGAKQAEPAAAPAAPKEKAVESAPQKSETTSENAKPEKEEPKEEEEPAAAELEPTAEETKELEPTAEETPVETTEPEIPKATEEETEETEETETTEEPTSESQPEPAQETKPETQQAQEEVTTPVSLPKRPTSNSRRLNQDAAVVMPTGAATIERIGMQFGSFNIGGVEVADTKPAATETPAAQPEAKEPA
ncbi:RNAPII degradation factor, partial [Linderina pennispora]